MISLAAQYEGIRLAIGGSRRVRGYEESFGLSVEEKAGITPVNKWQRRLFGQIEFALQLHKYGGAEFEEPIRQALDGLCACIERSGTITKQDVLEAEDKLLPLANAAKQYSLILCAHAHIDMNWMWGWQETVAATLDTFRTMLEIMREYPEFTYSQSQSSVYEIVERYEPSMMREIKQRIQEGRWEVTASAWVETDKNMPSTESLARHILYTKQYLKDTWGVPPELLRVDFSPDTFGHSAHLPELNQNGGVDYYYHCRGNDVEHVLYRWRAPSGREVFIYKEPYWYNSAITPRIGAGLVEISRRCAGLKTGLVVYGVGNHGGGPTRRDVERALDMRSWPIFPQVRFGTFHEFFKQAEAVRENLPLEEGEINFIFPGCYTTQSRIKMGNRQSEAALYNAEALSSLSGALLKKPSAAEPFTDAWRNVLFTHFHDILTGSCVQDSREYAMGLYAHAMAVANTQRSQAMRSLAEAIDTSTLIAQEDTAGSQSEGAGVGYGLEGGAPPAAERGAGLNRVYHVFNPDPHARKAITEITVWDWRGDLARMAFTNADGKPLRHQLLQKELSYYWDHSYVKVLVEADAPPLGYATLCLKEAPLDAYPVYYQPAERTEKPYQNIILENDALRAEFCYRTGALLSLTDKPSGKALIDPSRPAGLHYVLCDSATDTAWVIGRYQSVTELFDNVKVASLPAGDLRNGLTLEVPFAGSTAKAQITLDAGDAPLNVQLTVDWHEISKKGEPAPTLVFAAPHAYAASEYLYDVPAGAVTRKPMHLDVPGQTYGAALCQDGPSLVLCADTKYGYRGAEDTLSLTLIHAANSPDPYPERGIHTIRFALFAGSASPTANKSAAFTALNDPAYLSARPGKGTLPMTGSLMELKGGAILSGIKPAQDGNGVIARLYETDGKAASAELLFPMRVLSAQTVDILENPCSGDVSVKGNAVTVSLGKYSMTTVRITFA